MAGTGLASTIADTALKFGITKGLPCLAKKRLEAGRYYASEAIRNPKVQQKVIDYGLRKGKPLINEAGKAVINTFADYVEPENVKKAKREGRWKDKGLDIHKYIGKLPKPNAGWTPRGYKYMSPYNPLEEQLRYDPQKQERY